MSSTSKYHISLKTQRPNICKAKDGKCPLGGEHYETAEAAKFGYQKELAELNQTVPEVVKKNSDKKDVSSKIGGFEETQKFIEPEEKMPIIGLHTRSSNGFYAGVEPRSEAEDLTSDYYNDYYNDEDYYTQEPEPYYVVVDFEVKSNSKPVPEEILNNLAGIEKGERTPESLMKIGEKYNIADISSYEIYAEEGSDGAQAKIRLKENEKEFEDAVRSWGERNVINENDTVKMISLRNGIDPRQIKNIDLVKDSVIKQCNANEKELIKSTENLQTRSVPFSSIDFVDQDGDTSSDKPKKSDRVETFNTSGILVKNPETKKYTLVGNSKLFKNAKDNGRKNATFIVLS